MDNIWLPSSNRQIVGRVNRSSKVQLAELTEAFPVRPSAPYRIVHAPTAYCPFTNCWIKGDRDRRGPHTTRRRRPRHRRRGGSDARRRRPSRGQPAAAMRTGPAVEGTATAMEHGTYAMPPTPSSLASTIEAEAFGYSQGEAARLEEIPPYHKLGT